MNTKVLAPILLFTYKRLDTLKNTVEALRKNYLAAKSELFIFSDAAKSPKDEQLILEVRTFLKTIDGFKRVTIFESEINKGLANSIIEGVSKILIDYDRVIVLEDDLLTTPNFLNFMNDALDEYVQAQKVFSISGYSFDLGTGKAYNNDAYFLNRGWSWGWATWKTRWTDVDWLVKGYEDFLKNKSRQREFAKGGSDLNKMLKKQMKADLDSWAIRWFFHQFNKGGLTLYPILSKVYNNGFDAVATHTTGSGRRYRPNLDVKNFVKFSLPTDIGVTEHFQKKFQKKMGIVARIFSRVENIIKQIF